MGVSIRPDSWILRWFDNKKEQKLRIADYLDDIALEASYIAKIWDNVLTSLSSNGELDLQTKNQLDDYRLPLINQAHYARLESFYQRASSVLGSEDKNDLEYILFRISYILKERNITLEKVQKELSEIKKAKYFDNNNEVKNSLSIAESIELMHKEAAALYVFAKSYKAKI